MFKLRMLLTGAGLLFILISFSILAPEVSYAEPGQEFPLEITDQLGYSLTIDQKPLRLISMAPNTTEILFALGLEEKIVGVTDFCDYPPEARDIATIGGFADPSIEKIIALDPDLVLANEGLQTEITERLRELGITVISSAYAEDVEDVFEIIELFGRATGASDKAEELVADSRRELEDVVEKLSRYSAERPTVFVEIWHDPLGTTGPGSFISDLIERAGGQNAVTSGDDYIQYSLEQLIADDPDVYIAGRQSLPEPDAIKEREGWRELTAVRENRVYVVNEDLLFREGPRIIEGIKELAQSFHPDLFGAD